MIPPALCSTPGIAKPQVIPINVCGEFNGRNFPSIEFIHTIRGKHCTKWLNVYTIDGIGGSIPSLSLEPLQTRFITCGNNKRHPSFTEFSNTKRRGFKDFAKISALLLMRLADLD